MSEQYKQSPHVVIMSKIREIVSKNRQGGESMDLLRDLIKIATYTEVLNEMFIPENCLHDVLAELIQLSDLWDAKIGSLNMLRKLRITLVLSHK